MAWNKDNFSLIAQGITGHRIWAYEDTGDIGDVVDVAGYFQKAGEHGVDTGDFVFITATSGGTLNQRVHGAAFGTVLDTGSTQGSVGPGTVIGDTG